MRIFLKDIELKDISYLRNFPIQGIVFSINQYNAEKVRDIIEQVPFYLTILGEVDTSLKYEVEELIFFCKLTGLIKSKQKDQEFSCPQIFLDELSYNVFLNNKGIISTGKINLDYILEYQNIEGLVLNINEFIKFWPGILDIWTKNKVV